ncbi:hypothetical protein F4824DRAFT_444486 [Ustulina deusta]|nr:hypothetical protein F4824DRAFT_444486 [Ustulina deusta]
MVSWCSWLSRQSNTLKVSGSSPGEINRILFDDVDTYLAFCVAVGVSLLALAPCSYHQQHIANSIVTYSCFRQSRLDLAHARRDARNTKCD